MTIVLLASCAKTVPSQTNKSEKTYFDAWMQVHFPDLQPTPLGAYVISETEGTGALVGDSKNILLEVTIRGLDGTIASTTHPEIAKQVGTWAETNFYGPTIWPRESNALYAGLDEAVSTMRVGGTKTTIIPGWLSTRDRYDTPEEYIQNVTGTNGIYEIEVVDVINDLKKWEIDSIGSYLGHNFPQVTVQDSLKFGFYYMQTQPPTDTTTFPNDSTIYINYIGRLLNGQVFDTNICDTAKFYGLYNGSSKYTPTLINFNKDDYHNITMTSSKSNVVDGFAFALFQMRAFEKGTCVFYSTSGYGVSGSGSAIPPYSPLRFDIEIVDKP